MAKGSAVERRVFWLNIAEIWHEIVFFSFLIGIFRLTVTERYGGRCRQETEGEKEGSVII